MPYDLPGLQPDWANPATGPVPPSEDERMWASMRDRASKLISGEGLQSADELYAAREGGIRESNINLAGARAAQIASRGLARSGAARANQSGVRRKQANELAGARLESEQEARRSKEDALGMGESMMAQAKDYEQRKRLFDQALQDRMQQEKQAAEDADTEGAWKTGLGLALVNPLAGAGYGAYRGLKSLLDW